MAPRSPIRGPRSIHFSSPERKSAFATNAWVGVTRSGGPPPDVTRPSAQRYKGDRGKSGSGQTVSGQVGDRGCACHREDGTPGEETGRADARLDHGQPDTDDYHSTALRLVPVAERQLRRSIRGRGLIGRDPRREGRPPSDVDHPPGLHRSRGSRRLAGSRRSIRPPAARESASPESASQEGEDSAEEGHPFRRRDRSPAGRPPAGKWSVVRRAHPDDHGVTGSGLPLWVDRLPPPIVTAARGSHMGTCVCMRVSPWAGASGRSHRRQGGP